MMRPEEQSDYQIQSDDRVVWINGPDGMCVARFSRSGIDIHHDYAKQVESGEQCLDCRHTDLADREDWAHFRSRVRELFGGEVADHCPKFIGVLH